MAILDYLDSHAANNILEFGHGFNPTLLERYSKARNVWGVDDYQGLAYFGTPDRNAWEKRFDQEVRSKAPECTFRRGLLGGSCGADLPSNYFDVVCSVSVLEEVTIETVRDILKHAARLLKPGGALIGTHDLHAPERIGEYVAAHAAAGLELPIETLAPEINDKTLIENPTSVMIWYPVTSEQDGRQNVASAHNIRKRPAYRGGMTARLKQSSDRSDAVAPLGLFPARRRARARIESVQHRAGFVVLSPPASLRCMCQRLTLTTKAPPEMG